MIANLKNADTPDSLLGDFLDFTGADSAEQILSGAGIDSLISELVSAIGQGTGAVFSFFLLLVFTVLIASLAERFSTLGDKELARVSRAAVSSVSALSVFSALFPLVTTVSESLSQLSSFFSALIPIATGILASAGAINTAGVQAVNMNIALSVCSWLSGKLLLPLVLMMFALTLVSGLGGTKSIASSARSLFLWMVGIASVLVLAAAGMQSFFSSSADTAALRAAKYALSGTVPIVGSTVSGALSALWSGASYASSAVGVGSVLVITSIALSPLVLLLLYRLAISLAIAFSSALGASSAELLSGFRAAVDMLTALYTLNVIIYVVEAVIFMKCGVSVFG